VTNVSPLSKDTFQIELQSPADVALRYQAGQYLQLVLDLNGDGQGQSLFYSIANHFNPAQPHRLQLFIQDLSGLTHRIIKHLTELQHKNATVEVTLPMGRAYLQSDLTLPHVLIAAGSGISKIKCIAEEVIKRQPETELHIYWSNKKAADFYLLEQFRGWAKRYKNLKFTAILESADADWPGACGFIYEVVQNDFARLDKVQTYLCGSPQMVYGTIDKLSSSGLSEANCFSDVFEYAPRSKKYAVS